MTCEEEWEITFKERKVVYEWTEHHTLQEFNVKLYKYREDNRSLLNEGYIYCINCWMSESDFYYTYEPVNKEIKKSGDEFMLNDLEQALELVQEIKDHFSSFPVYSE